MSQSEDAWEKHMLPLIEELHAMIRLHDLPDLSADEALCELLCRRDIEKWKTYYLSDYIGRWLDAGEAYDLERKESD